MDILSERIQYHQCYTLTNCATLFLSQLSTKYNYIHQDSVLLLISEKSTIRTKTVSLFMSTYTNTRSGFTENITISTEATAIPTSPSPFVSKYVVFDISKEHFNKIHDKIDKNYAKLTNSMRNWLISNQIQFVSHTIKTCSNKKLPSFHQNSLNKRIISLHPPHPFKNTLRR